MPEKNWYQEPWAWLVAAPLILVFVVCAILVTTAIKYGDDVVTDDYYKEGKMVNNRFAAEAYALENGISGVLTLHESENRFSLTLSEPLNSNDTITLILSHPVESDYDHHFVLKRDSLKGYSVPAPAIRAGRWYVRLEGFSGDAQQLLWRIGNEIDFSQSLIVSLQ